jgi:hypothetical protein
MPGNNNNKGMVILLNECPNTKGNNQLPTTAINKMITINTNKNILNKTRID